jgi:hypothetical protein
MDLTALHQMVVVGESEALAADHPVFMIEQPASTIE